jgi:hypothetical protein
MGNQNLTGGLLGGLAQGLQTGQEMQYRRDMMRLQRDKMNADIKADELKQEQEAAQRQHSMEQLSQILPMLTGGGGGGMGEMAEAEPLGAGVMPTSTPPGAPPGTPAKPFAWQSQPGLKAHQPLIEKYAQQYGIPPARLAAFIDVESSGDPNKVSSAGARGLMQVMPETGKELGLTDDNAFDPEANVAAGAKYYAQLLSKYKGNEPMAIAAYYRGPGKVDAQGGVPADQDTMAYLQKHSQRVPFQRTSAISGQTAPGRPPRAPMTFTPTVNIGKDGGMSYSFVGQQQKYDVQHKEIKLPDGSIQTIQIVTDPITAQSWQQPFTAPAAPEAVIESQRQVAALGFPVGTEINKNAAARWRMIEQLPPDQRAIAMERLEDEARPYQSKTAPPGQGAPAAAAPSGGGSLSEEARRRDVETTREKEQARIRTGLAEERLPPTEAKLVGSLNRMDRSATMVNELFKPEYVGTPLQHYIGAHKGEWMKQQGLADSGKYSSGAFKGYVDGWIQNFKGTISPEQATFYRAIADMQDMILRERSGAAVSPGEFARVTGFTANVWDSPVAFKAGLDRVMDDIVKQRKDIYKTATGSASQEYQRIQETPIPAPKAKASTSSTAPAPAKDDKAAAERNAKGAMLLTGVETGSLSPQVAIEGLMALGIPRNAAEGVVGEAVKKIRKSKPQNPATQGQTGQRGYFD